MKPRFFPYFRLQCRRMLRQLPAALVVTALLLAAALALSGAMLEKSRSDAPLTRVRVGVVGDFENEYLSLGLFALQNLDPSRLEIELTVFDTEEAARAALLEGSAAAYVRIPDTFVESIRAGRVEPIRYVASGGAENIGAALTDEVAQAVAVLLTATQDAVYGTQHLVEDLLPKMKSWKAGDALGELYINQVLDRAALFDTEVLDAPQGMSLPEALLCGVLVLFLLLWGISACGVFARRESELWRMLSARGMGAAKQVTAELLAYLALLLVTLGVFLLPALLAVRAADLERFGLALHTGAVTRLALRLLAAAVLAGAMHFFLYELASGVVQSVLLQFLTAVSLGYVSGCLYPLRFFPEAMQRVGQWLPPGCAIAFLGAGLEHDAGLAPALGLLVWTILFAVGAIGLRRRKLQ